MRFEQSVTITEDHLTLLRNMYVDWDDMEYGAPCIDPKRPYGNSDVEGDIIEMLGWEVDEDEDQDWDNPVREKARLIHMQMQHVLQIILSNLGEDILGEWQYIDYKWKKV